MRRRYHLLTKVTGAGPVPVSPLLNLFLVFSCQPTKVTLLFVGLGLGPSERALNLKLIL